MIIIIPISGALASKLSEANVIINPKAEPRVGFGASGSVAGSHCLKPKPNILFFQFVPNVTLPLVYKVGHILENSGDSGSVCRFFLRQDENLLPYWPNAPPPPPQGEDTPKPENRRSAILDEVVEEEPMSLAVSSISFSLVE